MNKELQQNQLKSFWCVLIRTENCKQMQKFTYLDLTYFHICILPEQEENLLQFICCDRVRCQYFQQFYQLIGSFLT